MKSKQLVALLAVFIASAAVRIVGLENNPPGLFVDEAAAALDARSIILTGKDMWGESFPLFFRSLGDYNSGFHRYLMIPFVALFGLKIWSIRIVSALISLLTVIVCYFIGKKMGGFRLGLFAAMFFGFSPWSIMYARVAMEQVFFPFFLSLIIWAILVWRDANARFYRDLCLGALFGLTFYTYQPARVLVPLLFAGFIIIFFKRIGFKRALQITVGFTLALLPAIHFVLVRPHDFFARASILSIFSEPKPIADYVFNFISNYIAHYSPQFLFFEGDANIRHSPVGFGMMYPIAIFLIPLGFANLFKNKRELFWLFLLFAALYPFPAALTTTGIPHGLRSLGAIPALEILSALGLEFLLVEGKGRLKAAPLAFVIAELALFLVFAHHLFFKYPSYSKSQWRWDYKELFSELEPYKNTHQIVLVSYEPFAWVLAAFYWQVDPKEFQEKQRVFDLITPVPERFAKTYALPSGVLQKPERDKLTIVAYSAYPTTMSLPRAEPWKTIKFPDDKPAFYLYLSEPTTPGAP